MAKVFTNHQCRMIDFVMVSPSYIIYEPTMLNGELCNFEFTLNNIHKHMLESNTYIYEDKYGINTPSRNMVLTNPLGFNFNA